MLGEGVLPCRRALNRRSPQPCQSAGTCHGVPLVSKLTSFPDLEGVLGCVADVDGWLLIGRVGHLISS